MTQTISPRERTKIRQGIYGLYVIIDTEVTGGRTPIEIAVAALKGGARVIQLRDKTNDKGSTLRLAKDLASICKQQNTLLIINDHPDIAMIAGASGVHLGQGDLPVEDTRIVLHPRQIIGRSNYLKEEAMESQSLGSDYVAIGNIYRTNTKASIAARTPLGPETIQIIKPHINVPIVAIGGITLSNLGPIVKAGADSICVAAAVGLANDPEQATRALVSRIIESGGRA